MFKLDTFCILVICCLSVITEVKAKFGDTCYSFAGGSVYPQHEAKGEHKLQFTKAMSMSVQILILVFLLLICSQ